jgi:hypothetical protein
MTDTAVNSGLLVDNSVLQGTGVPKPTMFALIVTRKNAKMARA